MTRALNRQSYTFSPTEKDNDQNKRYMPRPVSRTEFDFIAKNRFVYLKLQCK